MTQRNTQGRERGVCLVDVWNTLNPDTCTVIRGLEYRLGSIMHRQLPTNERQCTAQKVYGYKYLHMW